MTPKKYDVFISYRRDGGIDSAVALQSTLRQMHYRVFLDVDGLHSGKFDEALLRHIDECKDFLLVLSPHALDRCMNEDDWVRREIEYAMSKGKNIIPIICDGGSVQERLSAELPESLASLPRYQVLETNVMQLQVMTQLLRTTLTAKPHNPGKGILTGAAIAAVICVIAFFTAGFVKDYLSNFPRTNAQKNMVSDAIAYTSLNLSHYNTAQGAYLKAMDSCLTYLTGSPEVTRSNLSSDLGFAMDTLEKADAGITDVDESLLSAMADTPLSTADMAAMADFLHMNLEEMYSNLLYLEYYLLDDAYTTSVSKKQWVECYRSMAVLTADTIILGVNSQFLPVNEEALEPLLRTHLPLLTNLYTDQTWCDTANEITLRDESLYKRQQSILARLESDVLQGDAMLEHERALNSLYAEVHASQRLAAARDELEKAKAELAAAKEKLYDVHKPRLEDDPEILFAKGTMFLSFDMLDAALESFAMYSVSDALNAEIIGDAAARFAIYQEATGIYSGVVVGEYEGGKTPQPDVMLGDIIYAVNGIDVTYVDDYINAKNGNAASTLHILRFTDAGYEKLVVQLDPNAGLIGIRSLAYQ